jgi:hypothetical protein
MDLINKLIIVCVIIIVGMAFYLNYNQKGSGNIKLEEKTLLNGELSMLMPSNFKPASGSTARELHFESSDGKAKLRIKDKTDRQSHLNLISVMAMYIQGFNRFYKPLHWIKQGPIKIAGRDFVIMEFDGSLKKRDEYALFVLTKYNGRVIMIGLVCDKDEMSTYQDIARDIKDSIRFR